MQPFIKLRKIIEARVHIPMRSLNFAELEPVRRATRQCNELSRGTPLEHFADFIDLCSKIRAQAFEGATARIAQLQQAKPTETSEMFTNGSSRDAGLARKFCTADDLSRAIIALRLECAPAGGQSQAAVLTVC